MAQNCPEKYDTLCAQEVALWLSDFDHPEQLKTFVSESWNSAVLDSGATNSVTGEVLCNCYITRNKRLNTIHQEIHTDLGMENYS